MRFPSRRATVLAASCVAILAAGIIAARMNGARAKGPDPLPVASGSVARAEVQLDERRQQLIGVRTARATRGAVGLRVRTPGIVNYDETRVADINLKLDGWVQRLHVNYTGQSVKTGDPLLALYSPDLVAAQIQFLSALRSREQSPVEQRDYLQGLLDTPRQRLLRWDVPADQVALLDSKREVLNEVIFRSPYSGVVIQKSVMTGMRVVAGQTLYKIADLSSVWVDADFPQSDMHALAVGGRAQASFDGWPGQTWAGRLVHLYPVIAEDTRRVRARIALPNRDGRLKPGMFGTVVIDGPSEEGVVVPADAVVDSGQRQVVFVALGGGRFEPRAITVGARAGDRVVIASGLREGEDVATRATFFLDSESQLRAALQNYDPAEAPVSAGAPMKNAGDIVITISNPARTGDNSIRATVKGADGGLVPDAEVEARASMPAMPSMNMPEMKTASRLSHTGAGVYAGRLQLTMAGRWDVTLTARRGGGAAIVKHTVVIVR